MTMERKQKEISPTKIQLIQELEFYDALIKQHKQEEMYKEGLTNMNEAANSKQDETMFDMKTADNKEKLKMTTSSEFQKKKSETSNPYKFIKHSPKRNLVKSASNSKNQSLKRYESKKSEVVPKNTKLEETNNKIKNMKEIIAQIELCQKQIKLQESTKISSEKCDTELHSSNEMTLKKDICSLSSHSPQEKGISNPSLKRKVHAVGNSILQKTGQKLLKQAVNTVTNRNVQDEKRISRYKLIKVKKGENRSQNVSTNKYKYLDSKFSKAKLQIATGKTKMAVKRSATMVDGEIYPGSSIAKMRKKSDNSYGSFYSSKFKLLRHTQSRHTEGSGKSYFLKQFQHKHRFAASHISLKRSSTVSQYKTRLKSRSNRKDSSRKLINKHCWYYKRFGKCSRGSKCPFQHGTEQVATKRSSPVDSKVIVKHKKSTHETDVGHSARKRRSSSITLQKYKKLGKESRGHKKSAKYCLYYNRFGKCNRGAKCNFLHDPSKIAVCTRFLRGTCLVYNCPFSHKVSKEKMPVCKFFLKGQCHKEDCYYLHVNVGENAEICAEFVRGYCPAGDQCKKKHVLQCPEYDKLGSCSKGTACKLKHVSVKAVEGGKRLDIQPQLSPKSCESKIDDKDDINLPFKDRILPAFISINTTSSSRAIKRLKKSLKEKPGESSEDSNVLTRTSILPSFISLSESSSKESNL